jgi:hypothetical protein
MRYQSCSQCMCTLCCPAATHPINTTDPLTPCCVAVYIMLHLCSEGCQGTGAPFVGDEARDYSVPCSLHFVTLLCSIKTTNAWVNHACRPPYCQLDMAGRKIPSAPRCCNRSRAHTHCQKTTSACCCCCLPHPIQRRLPLSVHTTTKVIGQGPRRRGVGCMCDTVLPSSRTSR